MTKGLPVLCCFFLLILAVACESLDTVNENDPNRTDIVSSGGDLLAALNSGYAAWWRGVHEDHPVIALSVAADAYGMAWGDWGANRMGKEPRTAYNNRSTEEVDYRQVAEAPWFGCLSAVTSANDVLMALDNGVSIDNGGPQDQTIRAAAHLLRGLAWGYLGLIFDRSILAEEASNPAQPLVFTPYPLVIDAAVTELDTAIGIAGVTGTDFTHTFFQGLTLRADAFIELCHSYAARFLAQWPRTASESAQVDWQAVLEHTNQGLSYDFAPMADGNRWTSYQKHVFAETGQGPFWARVDQRLIAAMDPSQPTRYPEVEAKGEAPLANPKATSDDRRLQTDFVYLESVNFPADLGEWHRSHYKHNRNQSDPSFAGDGSSGGPMPVFLAADNDLLRAEALLRLDRKSQAIDLLNAGTRTQRGQLPPLSMGASPEEVEQAILYERAIELLSTAPMGLWFDRRRTGPRLNYDEVDDLGGLQTGTPAQLPVPASELNVQGMEPYNFGGPNDPKGIEPVF